MRSWIGHFRRCSTSLSKNQILARHQTLDLIERSPEFASANSMLKSFTPNFYLENHPDPETALRIRQQMDEIAVLIEKMNAREQAGNKVLVMAAMVFLTSSLAYTVYQLSDVNTVFTSSLPSLFTVLEFSTARRFLTRLAEIDFLPVDFGSEDPYMIREVQFTKQHPRTRPMRVCIPVGLGAGIDVDCQGPGGFLKLGFGSIEVGPISIEPSQAVEENSLQLLPHSVIGHSRRSDGSLGLDEVGDRVSARIEQRDDDMLTRNTVIGASIKVCSVEDVSKMLSHANLIRTADYVSIDVTGIKDAESIVGIITRIDSESRKKDSVPPFFIKVSLGQSFPPSSAVTAAITASESVVGVNVAGYGLASGNNKQITKFSTSEDVTVSGVMIREKATQAVGEWYKALGCGSRGKEIIASGGVLTGKDALEKIEAGASFVNVFSAFVLDGPPVARRIKTQLSVQLMNKGYYNLDEAIGANHREKSRRLKHAEKRRKRF